MTENYPLSFAWKNSAVEKYYVYNDTENNLSLLFPQNQSKNQIKYNYITDIYEEECFDFMPGSRKMRNACVKWDKKELNRLYNNHFDLCHPMPDILVTRVVLKKKNKYKISFFLIKYDNKATYQMDICPH